MSQSMDNLYVNWLAWLGLGWIDILNIKLRFYIIWAQVTSHVLCLMLNLILDSVTANITIAFFLDANFNECENAYKSQA